MSVPLGINADENKTITISSESVHRPSTREVYLEDK